MNTFYVPDMSDKRISYAADGLTALGYKRADTDADADFILLGVNPDRSLLTDSLPIFAGNISGSNIFDYTREELFAAGNAYLTAEGALAEIINTTSSSLIGSSILIVGYGRIARALCRYLAPFTSNITICARDSSQRCNARMCCSRTIDIAGLRVPAQYDIVINTVPHPVINKEELSALGNDCVIFDLASFPGGVDRHLAVAQGKRLILSRGIPGRFSPRTAGQIVADTVHDMIQRGRVPV